MWVFSAKPQLYFPDQKAGSTPLKRVMFVTHQGIWLVRDSFDFLNGHKWRNLETTGLETLSALETQYRGPPLLQYRFGVSTKGHERLATNRRKRKEWYP